MNHAGSIDYGIFSSSNFTLTTSWPERLLALSQEHETTLKYTIEDGVAVIRITSLEQFMLLLPTYFRSNRYKSFQRQLTNFGFRLNEFPHGNYVEYRRVKDPPFNTKYDILHARSHDPFGSLHVRCGVKRKTFRRAGNTQHRSKNKKYKQPGASTKGKVYTGSGAYGHLPAALPDENDPIEEASFIFDTLSEDSTVTTDFSSHSDEALSVELAENMKTSKKSVEVQTLEVFPADTTLTFVPATGPVTSPIRCQEADDIITFEFFVRIPFYNLVSTDAIKCKLIELSTHTEDALMLLLDKYGFTKFEPPPTEAPSSHYEGTYEDLISDSSPGSSPGISIQRKGDEVTHEMENTSGILGSGQPCVDGLALLAAALGLVLE